jgi:hypothetical protein
MAGEAGAFRAANAALCAYTKHQTSNIKHLAAAPLNPASPGQTFVLGSFFSAFVRSDSGELHDVGDSLSGSILTQGRLECQFSVSDLG